MPVPLDSSPHLARANRVDRMMRDVLLGLVPGTLVMTWLFGWGVPLQIGLAALFGLGTEALVLRLRGRPIAPALTDCSALVTATLFALAIPPTLPWWLSLAGMVFAIALVKQLYGGLGYNPFNPAMAAYVFLLVSYPVEMTHWLAPAMPGGHALSLADTLQAVFHGAPPQGWDGISSATPLGDLRTRLDQGASVAQIGAGPLWGFLGGRGYEWAAGGFLLGGLYLLWRGTIAWRIPASMLGALAGLAAILWMLDPQGHAPPSFHLLSGAAMLGAFFIATDPVTACTTPRGQLVYGAAIGATTMVIRGFGGYPDAVAFAVLLLNIAVPTIDHYTRPRVFGHPRS